MRSHLRYVINGCILMTYGSRQRRPKSRAPQPRARFAAQGQASARCRRAVDARLLYLSTTGISVLQQAQRLKEPVAVAESKVAFAVKLRRSLIQRVRLYASVKRLSISEVVNRALLALLPRGRGRG